MKKKKRKYFAMILLLLCCIAMSICCSLFPRQTKRFFIRTSFQIARLFNNDEKLQSKNLKNFGIKMPLDYAVNGLDISKFQGEINWKAVKEMHVDSTQIDFVFMKATEGESSYDEWFEDNWKNAAKQNLIKGAYHFYHSQENSSNQAANFISTVTLAAGDLPPVLDVESISVDSKTLIAGVKNWLQKVELHYHIKPIIYTNIGFYEKYLSNQGLDNYPLWIAHYYEEAAGVNGNWCFWQHNDRGRVNGIKGDVDFDVFNGNKKELLSICLH